MDKRLILVVTGDEGIRELLEMVLDEEPYVRVVTASEDEEALAIVGNTPPALVLLDIGPRWLAEGVTLVRMLRILPVTQATPVIALIPILESRQEVLAAGCTDYIEKPFDLDYFLRKIRHHLPGIARTTAA